MWHIFTFICKHIYTVYEQISIWPLHIDQPAVRIYSISGWLLGKSDAKKGRKNNAFIPSSERSHLEYSYFPLLNALPRGFVFCAYMWRSKHHSRIGLTWCVISCVEHTCSLRDSQYLCENQMARHLFSNIFLMFTLKIGEDFHICLTCAYLFKWVGSTTNWDIKKTLQKIQELGTDQVHGTHDLDNSPQIHRASPHSPPVVFLLGSQLGSFSCLERYVCWDSMMVKPAVYLLLLNLPPRSLT